MDPVNWTQVELAKLIGQQETLQLEFKSGRLFEEKQPDTIADDLSRVVSAFANTEGGILILGMSEERRGKDKVATKLDGLPPAWTGHRIQQLIEGNIHPKVTVRVFPIQLSGTDRIVFVVKVPQGRTAHQAKDCVYYGRSEFEQTPLRDVDVRLRMDRGKAPFAEVDFVKPVRLIRSAQALLEEQTEALGRSGCDESAITRRTRRNSLS